VSVEALRRSVGRISIAGALTLVLISKRGKRVEAGIPPISRQMQKELRALCAQALDRLGEQRGRRYDWDAKLEKGEEHFLVTNDLVDQESALLAALRRVDALPPWRAADIEAHPPGLFAIAFGTGVNRTCFLRRRRALQTANVGHRWSFFGDTIEPVQTPLLMFDDKFDAIVREEGMLVFSDFAFDSLFHDEEDIQERTAADVERLTRQLPFDPETLERFTNAAGQKKGIQRRLRALASRPYLNNLDLPTVRRKLRAVNLDPNRFISRGRLTFAEEDSVLAIRILNEDPFVGLFSGTVYLSDAKAPIDNEA
jgi:hypothetical protein